MRWPPGGTRTDQPGRSSGRSGRGAQRRGRTPPVVTWPTRPGPRSREPRHVRNVAQPVETSERGRRRGIHGGHVCDRGTITLGHNIICRLSQKDYASHCDRLLHTCVHDADRKICFQPLMRRMIGEPLRFSRDERHGRVESRPMVRRPCMGIGGGPNLPVDSSYSIRSSPRRKDGQ